MNRTLIILLLLIVSCKEKIQVKSQNDITIKSNFINDSLPNGRAEYFKNNILTSVAYFKDGIKNGNVMNYHLNGKIYDSSYFFNGLQNGYHYIYDTSGTLTYIEYFFYGKKIGPQLFFNNGKISYYGFDDFEENRIYDMSYSNGVTTESNGEIINVVPYPVSYEGKQGLFIFLLSPPKISIDYKLLLRDTVIKSVDTLVTFTREKLFLDTLLSKPEKNKLYQVYAFVFDSTTRKGKIFIKELVYR